MDTTPGRYEVVPRWDGDEVRDWEVLDVLDGYAVLFTAKTFKEALRWADFADADWRKGGA